jgi:hypothetical protein
MDDRAPAHPRRTRVVRRETVPDHDAPRRRRYLAASRDIISLQAALFFIVS